MGDKERILVTVKTYPTLSTKYGETVCTAGLREDGSWIRLYPVPFRRLSDGEQYRKYDWLECRVIKQPRDRRPESFRPLDESELVAVDRLGTADGWRTRREVLERGVVHERLRPLLDGARANELSLATFKPARITDFLIEPDMDRDWDEARVRKMLEGQNQFHLWEDNEWRMTFELVQKVPYKFRYRFEDADGVSSKLRILDWELGQLYWNCLRAADGREERALEKVRAKYFDEIAKTKDVHLFLGTIYAFHGRSENPWSIVGVFYPPVTKQLRLL